MQAPPRQLSMRREYLGLLRLILEGRGKKGWRAYRNATVAAFDEVFSARN